MQGESRVDGRARHQRFCNGQHRRRDPEPERPCELEYFTRVVSCCTQFGFPSQKRTSRMMTTHTVLGCPIEMQRNRNGKRRRTNFTAIIDIGCQHVGVNTCRSKAQFPRRSSTPTLFPRATLSLSNHGAGTTTLVKILSRITRPIAGWTIFLTDGSVRAFPRRRLRRLAPPWSPGNSLSGLSRLPPSFFSAGFLGYPLRSLAFGHAAGPDRAMSLDMLRSA